MSDLAAANKLIVQIYENIGEQIKTARENRGVAQSELAMSIGLNRSSVANIEGGRQRIQIHAMIATCQALGIDPADMITRAIEGSDPLAPVFSRSATQHTARLRKNLITAQANIAKLIAELPDPEGS